MKNEITNDLGRVPRLGISQFAVPEVTSFESRQAPEMRSASKSMRERRPQRRPSSSTPSIARLVNPYGRNVRKKKIYILPHNTRIQIIGGGERVVNTRAMPTSSTQVTAAVCNAAVQRKKKPRQSSTKPQHRSRGSRASRPLLRASDSGREPLRYQLAKWLRTRFAKSRKDTDNFATSF